ncbi:MAG: TonB family protein [Cytophagales bacterium]|nr:TonB family protein [Cytophagales bacterium]
MEAKKNPNKDVHRQSGKFFLIGLTLSVAMAITAFEWRSEKKVYVIDSPDEPIYDGAFIIKSEPISVDQPNKPKELKPQVIKPLVNLVATTELIEESNEEVVAIEPTDFTPIRFDSTVNVIEPPEPIFLAPEVKPEPVGGFEGFYKFVGKNLKYPKRAQYTHTQGKVYVEFIVDKNGIVSDLKVVKGIGSGCDEEAMRVLALTKWQPGRQRGKPVNVRMTMPLNFVLN